MPSVWKRRKDEGNPDAPWLITYRENGKRRTIVGGTVHKAAQQLARKLASDEVLRQRGVLDPVAEELAVQGQRPLEEHVDEYEQHLRDKASSDRHVTSTLAYLHEVVGALNWQTVRSISAAQLSRHLADRRRANGTGKRTTNARVVAWKSFARWLVRHGRLAADPLASLSRLREDDDRRLVRRVFTDDELGRLVEAAERGPALGNIPGLDRGMLYRVLNATGLRRSEAESLTAADFRLDAGGGPLVVVKASYTKNRREVAQPLPSALAGALRAWLDGKDQDARLWPLPDKARRRVLLPDLRAAGIAPATPAGLIDFHGFRHTYVTRLVRSAIPIKAVQTLARHADPALTLKVYSHLSLADERSALERAFAPPARGERSRDGGGVGDMRAAPGSARTA